MICPKCEDKDIEMIFEDNSFDHAFGTEIVKFYYCPNCEYQTDESDEPDPDEEHDRRCDR